MASYIIYGLIARGGVMSITKAKEFIDLAQKVVMIIAVIVGGSWTWMLFLQHREPYAKATIS